MEDHFTDSTDTKEPLLIDIIWEQHLQEEASLPPLPEESRKRLEALNKKWDLEREAEMRIRDAEAKAKGYASEMDMYDCQIREAEEQQEREFQEEASKRNISLQQFKEERQAAIDREIAEQNKLYPPPYSSEAICHCKVELCDTWFCPNAGESLHSMKVDEDWRSYIEEQKRAKLEDLKIEPGERSRRLPSPILERCWMQDSQQRELDIPVWMRGDKVVQSLMATSDRYKNNTTRARTPISPSVFSDDSQITNSTRSSPISEKGHHHRKIAAPQDTSAIPLKGSSPKISQMLPRSPTATAKRKRRLSIEDNCEESVSDQGRGGKRRKVKRAQSCQGRSSALKDNARRRSSIGS